MRHKHLQKFVTLHNVAKIGGRTIYWSVDTSVKEYGDDRRDFVSLIRTHGYDILSPSDFFFPEKVNQYNRILELKAKAGGCETYEKYAFSELCVCGPWLFTEFSFPPTQEATVKDNRGGFRPGAGRKSKNACLWSTQTAPIRVPAWQKDSIKGFIDWLIEKESECESVHELLLHAMHNSERIAEELSREGLHQQAQKESKKAVLFHELYEKLPRFDVKHHKVPAVLKNDAANRQIIDLVNSEEEDPRQMHIDFDE